MKLKSKLLLALLAISGAAFADEAAAPADALAYNIGVASQYRYRGIAQTRGEPALQGGADFTAATGWYVGTWASTITWISDEGNKAGVSGIKGPVELDLYGGYRFNVGDVALDTGFLRYEYATNNLQDLSGAVNANTNEVYAAATAGVFTFKYSYSLSNLFGNADSKGSQYFDLSATFDLGEGYSLVPHVGRQDFGNNNGTSNSGLQYSDYALTLNKDLGNGLSASAAAIGTNAGQAAYTLNGSNYYQGKSTLVVGVKYTF